MILGIETIQIQFDSGSLQLMNVALGLIMFGIALDIRLSHFKLLWQSPKSILVGLLSQFVVLQLLTFLLVYWLRPEMNTALGMFLVAACPGGNVSNFMSHIAKGNSALSVSLTALSSIGAVFMTPMLFSGFSSLYFELSASPEGLEVSFIEMFKVVVFILAIPLLLGMTFAHLYPGRTQKLSKGFKLGSMLFFVALVGVMIAQNRTAFQFSVLSLFVIVVLHNALALTSGYGVGTLFKLKPAERRTLTIETGIQNSGLGLLLIFTFFDQNQSMAVVAALWGIWHLVSGLGLAFYWSKHPINS
jgi:BASS family bile acid:Na+ symporter